MRHRSHAGFTLIELMITMVVIAILSAVAYPSYVQYATKSRRTEAKGCLFELSQFVERYAIGNNGSYLSAANAAPTLPTLDCTTSLASHYTLEFDSGQPTAVTYTLKATPKGTQASKDTLCGTLTLSHTGAKTESGTGSVSDCW